MSKQKLVIMSLVFILALVGCGTKTTGNGTLIAGGADMPTNSDVVDTEKIQTATNETDEETENGKLIVESVEGSDDQAIQVGKEFCLDNGYSEKEINIREGGSEGYVLDIIADKDNETKQITLTVRKFENGSLEVVGHNVQSR